MEQELYFKPGNYGKGIEKKSEEKPSSTPKEKGKGKAVKLIIVLLFLVITIAVVWYLLRGKTTTTSEQIPNVKTTSLVCSSDSFVYPLFRYDDAKSRKLEMKMVFSSEDLKSIALEYSLFYDSADLVKASEAHNHAEMNHDFAASGLNPDSYDAKYTILSDRFRMNLYATPKKLDETAKRYFLIESDGDFPTSVTNLRENYESEGLTCVYSEGE